MTIRFGIHAGQQDASYADVVRLWRRAEELGFDWVSLHDHFVPLVSDPDGPIFDALAMLAAAATETERVRLGVIVLGVTYRHPALVAKMATTIDHISGGRLELGMGAAWYEPEHRALGYRFPPIGERMDMLDEACTVMRRLWTDEVANFDGAHFTLQDARMQPKPLQEHLPLAIGGTGERRTLRIVARHADIWHCHLTTPDEYRHKLDVLDRHCSEVGRDPAGIRKSLTFRAVLAADEAEARGRADAVIDNHRRFAGEQLTDEQAEILRKMMFVGTAEGCVEHLRSFVDLGAGDFLLNATPPTDWETIERVAKTVMPALRA
jgi:F420-dependent oxidoreductase-like protein